MSVDVNGLADAMIGAARGAVGATWENMRVFAVPELRKIAVQIGAIADHLDEITPETAQALLRMQINAAAAVIVAMTELVLVEAERAINAILAAVRDMVNGAIGFPLV